MSRSLALLGVAALLLSGHGQGSEAAAAPRQAPQYLPIEARWCLAPGRCVELEVPRGDRQFAIGLQLRPPLKPLQGMWFDFGSPSLARFWMHRTPAALDMVFIREGRVVAIEANAPPCMRLPCPSYGPDTLVQSVVELAAGQAEALGIKVGSAAVIHSFKPVGADPAAPARD